MPGFHVNDLKNNTGAYARGYLFNVYFDAAPVGGLIGGESQTAYLVRSSSLPAGSIDPIEVPWQGQTYQIGSTHSYDTWSCTFNVDRFANVRKNMEEWQRQVHDPSSNIQGIPSVYFGIVKVELLDVVSDPVMIYTLNQAWPSEVGTADVAHDNKDVLQFDVTFTYNWHTSV